MKQKKYKCTKKPYAKLKDAKAALGMILSLSKKCPERNEISIYKCEHCDQYHTSSKPTEYSLKKISNKSYFELQNEKWSSFLHKYSANKGRV